MSTLSSCCKHIFPPPLKNPPKGFVILDNGKAVMQVDNTIVLSMVKLKK